MPRIARIQFPGAYYHVIARGIERRPIYLNNKERERFLEFLRDAQKKFQITVFAYCLMDNHYHLLIQTAAANLSQTMKYLNGCYATYINAKRKRVGHVFAYRFKSIVVEEEKYLLTLSRYIHLNPLKAGMVDKPEEYIWSSYRAYLGYLDAPWLQCEWILKIFSDRIQEARRRYRQFVDEEKNEKETDHLEEEPYQGAVLGSKEFIELTLKQNQKEVKMFEKEKPGTKPTLNEIKELVDCSNKWSIKTKRKIAVYLSRQFTDETYEAIGALFGLKSKQAANNIANRFSLELEKDKELENEVNCLVEKLEE